MGRRRKSLKSSPLFDTNEVSARAYDDEAQQKTSEIASYIYAPQKHVVAEETKRVELEKSFSAYLKSHRIQFTAAAIIPDVAKSDAKKNPCHGTLESVMFSAGACIHMHVHIAIADTVSPLPSSV